MEVVNLFAASETLRKEIEKRHPSDTVKHIVQQIDRCKKKPSESSISYAVKWQRRGQEYFSLQEEEYTALFAFLGLDVADGCSKPPGLLFLSPYPGTAITRLPKTVTEWMACDLRPATDDKRADFPDLRDDLFFAQKLDGQQRVFRPHCAMSDMFTDHHVFTLLNCVPQTYSIVIADATRNQQYDFHMQIALNRVKPDSLDGAFVWRVDTEFLEKQIDKILLVAAHFESVDVCTLRKSETFNTHFIVARRRRRTSEQYPAIDKEHIITNIALLISYWQTNKMMFAVSVHCIAEYFASVGLVTDRQADTHWAKHSGVVKITNLLHRDETDGTVQLV